MLAKGANMRSAKSRVVDLLCTLLIVSAVCYAILDTILFIWITVVNCANTICMSYFYYINSDKYHENHQE